MKLHFIIQFISCFTSGDFIDEFLFLIANIGNINLSENEKQMYKFFFETKYHNNKVSNVERRTNWGYKIELLELMMKMYFL